MLGEVFNALPRPVKDLIRREPRATYKQLADAVLAIDIGDLRDSARDHIRNEETARLARTPPSPTKAVREMLSATHIQAPHRMPQQTNISSATSRPAQLPPTNPFAMAGGRGNLFPWVTQHETTANRGVNPGALGIGRRTTLAQPANQQSNALRSRPIEERYADLTNFTLPQHPDTADGHTRHRAQCATWHTSNPTSKPDEQHPYPLTPGTSPAGSFECWSCGQKGHRQGAGPGICPGDHLPEPERDWRRIASYITCEYNKQRLGQAIPVNHVSTSALTYPEYHQALFEAPLYPGEVDDLPGNGQGSSV